MTQDKPATIALPVDTLTRCALLAAIYRNHVNGVDEDEIVRGYLTLRTVPTHDLPLLASACRTTARDGCDKFGVTDPQARDALLTIADTVLDDYNTRAGFEFEVESDHVYEDSDGTPAVSVTYGNRTETITPEAARDLAEALVEAAIAAENACERDDTDRAADRFDSQIG